MIFEGAKVACSDPFVRDKDFVDQNELIRESDIIIIGVPHDIYKDIVFDNKKTVDIWNII